MKWTDLWRDDAAQMDLRPATEGVLEIRQSETLRTQTNKMLTC